MAESGGPWQDLEPLQFFATVEPFETPTPLEVLRTIADYPADSNSDPDVLAAAVDELRRLAREAIR